MYYCCKMTYSVERRHHRWSVCKVRWCCHIVYYLNVTMLMFDLFHVNYASEQMFTLQSPVRSLTIGAAASSRISCPYVVSEPDLLLYHTGLSLGCYTLSRTLPRRAMPKTIYMSDFNSYFYSCLILYLSVYINFRKWGINNNYIKAVNDLDILLNTLYRCTLQHKYLKTICSYYYISKYTPRISRRVHRTEGLTAGL